MGQLIRPVAIPAVCADACSELIAAESISLLAMRWWVSDSLSAADPLPRDHHAMRVAGIPEAAVSINAFMAVVARSARRPVVVKRPRSPHVSGDEAHLLRATALAQHGDSALAEKVLRTALLSAEGASFALGPLEGLGRLFLQARLLFRTRPDASRPTIH